MENTPLALYRVVGILTKRHAVIYTLRSTSRAKNGVLSLHMTVDLDARVVSTVTKQMNRIIEVKTVSYHV
jgi:acetolactate synthase regulatory subunit